MPTNCGENLILVSTSSLVKIKQWKKYLGADFDLAESGPGDIDPHAVSSVFRAYLRECMLT